MMIGAETLPTTSSTSSATPSGRGCRDGEEGRSASRSVRRPATKRSRRSARRSEAGPFTNAATRRWMIWRACSMRISAAGSTTTGGSTRRLSTRPYGASTSFWRDGPTGSSSPCAGTRHEPFTGCNASRAARLACCSLGLALWTRPNNGSRMTRECHVRFCESAGVRSPRATHRNIYVRSRRAGERVMASVSRFLTNRLRLKVKAKSAVARPEERKFLGFSISNDGSKRRIAPKALDTFKGRVRDMTRRTRGFSLQQSIKELKPYIVGWRGYFGFCQTPRSPHEPRSVDPSKIAFVSLAAMANQAKPLRGVTPSRRSKVCRSGRSWFTNRALAHVRTSGGPTSFPQRLFRVARSSPNLCARPSLTRSNRRGTGPVCPVVWQGWRREARTYPDQSPSHSIDGARYERKSLARRH